MKKIWNLLFAVALVAGFVGCNSECDKKSKTATADVAAEGCEDFYALRPGVATNEENKVETIVNGPYLFGQKNGAYNLCTSFVEGKGPKHPSELHLHLGVVRDDTLRMIQPGDADYLDVNLGDSNLNTGVEWFIKNDSVYFQVVELFAEVRSNKVEHLLSANAKVAIKLVDGFKTGGIKEPVPALIGGEDIRSDYYNHKKVISYGDVGSDGGVAGLFYQSKNDESGTLVNLPIGCNNHSTKDEDRYGLAKILWSCYCSGGKKCP